MPDCQDQPVDDNLSPNSAGTTFRSNDSDAIELSLSDYESEYVPSETSSDLAFVVSDTDALSYLSDKPSVEGEVSCGIREGIVEEIEDVSNFKNTTKMI